jgi:2-keto-3-deoxy-L-rhamnonate aldolase RhmA
MTRPLSTVRTPTFLSTLAATVLLAACGGDAPPADDAGGDPADTAPAVTQSLSELLGAGQSIFGTFSGPQTPEQGRAIVANRDADFILYSLESGPFDIPAMSAYLAAMDAEAAATGMSAQPVWLRVPPIHADEEAAPGYAADALAAGVDGIVFPHVTTAAEAATSVTLMGEPWPLGDAGLNVLIVEDREGVSNVREIMATPGLSVVFAGPGDLRRAYEGDMEAVENAIQAVLAACLEFDVACGVTAGVDDIGTRLDQGFRVIIVTQEEALAVGRSHAGR